jgi:hypothetical protein
MQLAAPVLANGTAAGTQITNTATASYEDPTDPTKPLNTFSNTVKVEVAEVAGITVVADTFTVVDGATLAATNAGAVAGNKVYFDYTVTNVGNDPTQLRIPGTATSTGASSVDRVEFSLDGGASWNPIDPAGDYTSPSKAPGDSIKVRVVTTILSGAAANSPVTVTLGRTGTPGDQNTDRAADTSGGDVYTIDNSGTTGGASFGGVSYNEVNGAPSNGVREASAFQTILIGATPQAFATVSKVRGTVATQGTTALTDDTLSYDLAVKVADQIDVPTTSNTIAADLLGTEIQLATSATAAAVPAMRILVSDAVPQYTTAETLVAPSGWEAVYTTELTSVKANDAKWINLGAGTVTVPAGATRVGFISSSKVAKGTTTPAMTVTVKFTSMPATGANVANIAQVFGSTPQADGTTPDLNKPVYDESGDNKPNNYSDNGTPSPVDPITGKPVVDSGVVDPANPGVTDSSNNNTGAGDAGEPNVIAIVPASQIGILNGTSGHADAVGPTGNNDDFTNVSVPIPASTWTLDPATGKYTPSAIDPAAVPFSNTLESTAAGNVSLLPTTPAATATPLPEGTKVTITQGSTSKTFEFKGGIFVDAGTNTPATPLVIPNVLANTKVNYGVEVDLPKDTEQLKGYGVPITATSATGASNTTIDRVYTGYLKLLKEAQITDANGGIIAAFGTGDAVTGVLAQKALPGQLIQYRITYTNISDVAPVGSNSVALSAQNIRVTEDGTASPNNWATNSTHKSGSATDTNNGAITYDAGKSNTSPDVNVYTDLVAPTGSAPLAPQQAGSFSFTRVVK